MKGIKRQFKRVLYLIIKWLKRLEKPANWIDLRNTIPISKEFGLDRGTPIDRIYIEHFLKNNKKHIKGVVCEIADNTYSKKFGSGVSKFEILHFSDDNEKATIIGDLTDFTSIPFNQIDCFILTQTLNFIYDFESAIKGVHKMLKNNGIALVTVSGISQISRYDADRWGDYWRFTDLSMKLIFEEVFGQGNVELDSYGNVLSSVAFLEGISAEELTKNELFYKDDNYQITITIKAIKR